MTEPAGPTTEKPADAEVDPGTGETETDWKKMARQWESRSKAKDKEIEALKPKAERYDALESASKSESEKMQEQLNSLQQHLDSQRTATVQARIERLAADDFADPSDAVAALDWHGFLTLEGTVNDAAIKQELADLLDAKPHWRKSDEKGGRRPPAVNPAQGTGGQPAPVNKGSLFAAALQQAQGGRS